MSCFNSFLRLCTQNILPFQSNKTKGIDNIKVDRAGRRNSKGKNEEKVEKDEYPLEVIISYSHRHGEKIDEHANNPINDQKVYTTFKEVRSC